MPSKSPLQKLQDAVAETVQGVVSDPAGATAKAAEQVRGAISIGLTIAGQVATQVAEKLTGGTETEEPSAPARLRVAEDPDRGVTATPADVARVAPAKKAPPKKAPAKKAPARKATPSGKLPAKKAPAKKAPAKKAPAKKAPAKKAAAKKAPAKKAPAKKSAPTAAARPLTAAEVVEDAATSTPLETITSTDVPGTEPLIDPATTKSVASEAETLARAADPDKG